MSTKSLKNSVSKIITPTSAGAGDTDELTTLRAELTASTDEAADGNTPGLLILGLEGAGEGLEIGLETAAELGEEGRAASEEDTLATDELMLVTSEALAGIEGCTELEDGERGEITGAATIEEEGLELGDDGLDDTGLGDAWPKLDELTLDDTLLGTAGTTADEDGLLTGLERELGLDTGEPIGAPELLGLLEEGIIPSGEDDPGDVLLNTGLIEDGDTGEDAVGLLGVTALTDEALDEEDRDDGLEGDIGLRELAKLDGSNDEDRDTEELLEELEGLEREDGNELDGEGLEAGAELDELDREGEDEEAIELIEDDGAIDEGDEMTTLTPLPEDELLLDEDEIAELAVIDDLDDTGDELEEEEEDEELLDGLDNAEDPADDTKEDGLDSGEEPLDDEDELDDALEAPDEASDEAREELLLDELLLEDNDELDGDGPGV